MFKLSFNLAICAFLVIFEKLNCNPQIEAPRSQVEEADKTSDKFVLIGHSEINDKRPKLLQEHKSRQKKHQSKDYYSRDHYINKYNSYMDQETEDNDLKNSLHQNQNMTSYYNPRSGIYANRFGGNSNGIGYSYNGNGYSGGNSNGGFLSTGLFGGGLLGLHLLDPLILLATLSFVLFLVNSVITLVERLRFPIGGHVGTLGRKADDPARHVLVDQELIAELGQYFHQLVLDYEHKLKNETKKAY